MREQIDFKRFPWTRTGNHIYKILLIYKKRINIHIAASDGLVSKCGAKPWKVSTVDETVIKDWLILKMDKKLKHDTKIIVESKLFWNFP